MPSLRSPCPSFLSSASTKLWHRPMGCCFSKPTVYGPPSLDARDVISQEPTLPQLQGGAEPGREPAQVTNDEPSYGRRRPRDRAQSTPHQAHVNGVEVPIPRLRAKSSIASPSSSRNPNPDHRRTSTGKCDLGRARGSFAYSDKNTRGLLPDELERILSPAGRSTLQCGK